MNHVLQDDYSGVFKPNSLRNILNGSIVSSINMLKSNKAIITISILFILIALPPIFYGNHDARMLEVVSADDAPITMQLEGMTVPPYGNPANYLKAENITSLPKHWYDMNYAGIIYYGGFYLDLAFTIFAPLKWLGLAETFPHAPFILKLVSVISGLFSLTILFQFTKRYWGILPASLGCLFLITDPYFMMFSSRIHPDILLCLLVFLGLSTSVSYVIQPKGLKLVGLGIILGLAQGTKVGAPWLLPMALTALSLGTHKQISTLNRECIFLIAKNFLILGLISIVFFIISTPYAIFDSYYFTTIKKAFKANTGQSPVLSNVNIITWLTDTYQYLGKTVSWIVILTLVSSLFQLFKMKFTKKGEIAFLFIIILIFSNFLWHGMISSYWAPIQYLIPSMALIGTLFGIQMSNILEKFKQYHSFTLSCLGNLFIISITIVMFIYPLDQPRWFSAVRYGLQRINLNYWTALEIGRWAAQHIPPNSRIQHDGFVYLDPVLFPNQNMGSNVIQYNRILKYRPDYIILTDWKNNWVEGKINTQRFEQCNPDPYSVRLYQDLIHKIPRLGRKALH